jgi:tellurite resistance protein TerC
MMGAELGAAFYVGWGLEKTLALDNLFAIMAVMGSFGLLHESKLKLQYRILHWGILGAIFFRVLFLSTGAFFVNLPTVNILGYEFNLVMTFFALIILWTVKSMWNEVFNKNGDGEEEEYDYTGHWSVNVVKRFFPVEPSIESGKFFVKKEGFRDENTGVDIKAMTYVTPLFLCLICVEVFDVIFSFDSMPVIVAVVKDPNIMITSTLLACAGLRAFYFCIEALKSTFIHLDKAIIAILLFIVGKLLLVSVGHHIDNAISLLVVGTLIGLGILASKIFPERKEEESVDS